MLNQLKVLLYSLMSQFVLPLSFLVKRRIEFCTYVGHCAMLINMFWNCGSCEHSILLALSRSFLSRAQMLTIRLCSAVRVSADEVQCRAQTKTLPNLCWVGAGIPCHPIHAVPLQGRGRLNGSGQAQWVCPPSWDPWEGEGGGRNSRARETECTRAGKASATPVDSRRESEKDPVAQRRLPSFPNESLQ